VTDVSTLMGKLKANVAYRQFNDSASEDKSTWPVIERMARAQAFAASPESPAPQVQTAQAPAAPIAVAPPLSSASRPAAVLAPAPVAAKPAAPAPAQPSTVRAAPILGGGSILRRYGVAAEAPAESPAPKAPAPRALSDLFAHLERKAP
jgi:hypothetical protein